MSASKAPKFSDALLRLRKRLAITQTGLGRTMAVSGHAVRRWEHGRGLPASDHLRALVRLADRHDSELGTALATTAGRTRATLEVPLPGTSLGGAAGSTLAELAIEGLVAILAERLDRNPRDVRPALLALAERVEAAKIAMPDVIRTLRAREGQ